MLRANTAASCFAGQNRLARSDNASEARAAPSAKPMTMPICKPGDREQMREARCAERCMIRLGDASGRAGQQRHATPRRARRERGGDPLGDGFAQPLDPRREAARRIAGRRSGRGQGRSRRHRGRRRRRRVGCPSRLAARAAVADAPSPGHASVSPVSTGVSSPAASRMRTMRMICRGLDRVRARAGRAGRGMLVRGQHDVAEGHPAPVGQDLHAADDRPWPCGRERAGRPRSAADGRWRIAPTAKPSAAKPRARPDRPGQSPGGRTHRRREPGDREFGADPGGRLDAQTIIGQHADAHEHRQPEHEPAALGFREVPQSLAEARRRRRAGPPGSGGRTDAAARSIGQGPTGECFAWW